MKDKNSTRRKQVHVIIYGGAPYAFISLCCYIKLNTTVQCLVLKTVNGLGSDRSRVNSNETNKSK